MRACYSTLCTSCPLTVLKGFEPCSFVACESFLRVKSDGLLIVVEFSCLRFDDCRIVSRVRAGALRCWARSRVVD
jgi:hypothetical protein